MTEPHKVCTRCGEDKPWSAYSAHTRNPDGSTLTPRGQCRACRKDASAAHRRRIRKPVRTRTAGPLMASGPFRAWLLERLHRYEHIQAMAEDIGMDETVLRRVLRDPTKKFVALDTVDRALLNVGDGTRIDDLYGPPIPTPMENAA